MAAKAPLLAPQKASPIAANPLRQIVAEALSSSGQDLHPHTGRSLRPYGGRHDFTSVRVHTDHTAATSAASMNAFAYTVGNHIVFDRNAYSPGTPSGDRLLAHELAHTVQQGRLHTLPPDLRVTSAGDSSETAAELFAHGARGPLTRTPIQVARAPRNAGSGPAIEQGYPRRNGSETRDWVDQQSFETLSNVPASGKTQMINKLLDWWVHDEDLDAISKICNSVSSESEMAQIRDAISPRELDLESIGQRTRLRLILSHRVKPRTPDPTNTPQVAQPPSVQGGPSATDRKLQFFHGSRWSIAKIIPKNVRPLGGGDFAAGFYTHVDADNSKALNRALTWARRIAQTKPAEKYAGIVRFSVPESEHRKVAAGSNSKEFGLTSLDQPDYKKKQAEWLDFVTSHGRESTPVFKAGRGQWVHDRREPQPQLPYNVISGPFYGPIRGTKDTPPQPADFKPYAEGRTLPQQVLWANRGIDLLNSSKVDTELTQYDAKSGKRQDPPVNTASTISTLDHKQLADATEEAQFAMGR